jgi:IS30 family transposase
VLGNYTFIVVVVKDFMKWVKVKPLTNVSSATIRKFFWQNIICHYGVPRHITVDNTKYFDSAMLKDFCQHIEMKVTFASVYHPQTNGEVERANSLIFEAIKKILEGD